ncbi:MAG: 3-dehydroquinate synthase [Verrucomicrobiales bacterium]|nr:3-dehydroquinate synthase [Verrucomicrobiales bacterium]
MIDHAIRLTFRHRVIFTEGVFAPENRTLVEVLQMGGETRRTRCRVLVLLDAGLVQADRSLPHRAAAWFAHHQNCLDLRGAPVVLPGGEACKNDLELVRALWRRFNEAGLDRHSCVVAIGGGAFLDLAGFAAATAHRGLRLVRLPTTTLSQGDGGVGVKNGINQFGKKNWVGTFAVPFAVINDLAFLPLLPPEERRAGFIEAVKVSLIRDGEFFRRIEQLAPLLREFELSAVREVIERSAALHVRHIATGGDPFEMGSARPLDFGHWVAHKLEQLTEFSVSHGSAVAIGMAVDLVYAELSGMLAPDACERILSLIRKLGFATWHPGLQQADQTGEPAILRGLEEFREHLGGDLCVTLVTGIGDAVEVREMDRPRVIQALEKLRQA